MTDSLEPQSGGNGAAGHTTPTQANPAADATGVSDADKAAAARADRAAFIAALGFPVLVIIGGFWASSFRILPRASRRR